MKAVIAEQLRKSVWGLSAAYMVNDVLWNWKLKTGRFESGGGTTHEALEPGASVRYIRDVFEDYKRYGNVERFSGRAAELGPGDNAGVALLLRADGCDSVDLVDRYYCRRDPSHQQRIYEALGAEFPNTLIWKAPFDDKTIPGIRWRTDCAAEEHFARAANEGQRYDVIISRSVLEHLYDPLGCIRSMAACLAPGGKMIHKVDLRDHGMFAPTGNPLKFLEIPTFLYRRMTRYSGRPNRILFHHYRETLEELSRTRGIRYSLAVTRLAGAGDVLPHRPIDEVDPAQVRTAVRFVEQQRARFAREFDHVAPVDLSIQGMFIVASPG